MKQLLLLAALPGALLAQALEGGRPDAQSEPGDSHGLQDHEG
jgi:hypothetical protein